MTIDYSPKSGFSIDKISIKWSESREVVREKLNQKHKEDDKIIELAQFFDGDKSYDINQLRDIYESSNLSKSYFFLNYDKNGGLSELEIHGGAKIMLHGIILEFEMPIEIVLDKLSVFNEAYEANAGNYLFPNLNISISTDEAMGGEGKRLSYFYAAKDIQDLKDLR
ncbi:hypothetical protein [Pedobacter sp.]|uniref:hypothetical protein n=1 Tax=Pedobacter sp. TaxID=1411316 RepID=UPI0031D2DA27